MSRKKLNIGLFGFGCVGYGLYEVLHKTPGLNAEIKKICVKQRDKIRQLPSHYFSFDKNDILNNEEINVVVELIDDADAAFELVSAALMSGKAVVSANKKMIAEHFNELVDLQRQYKVPLLYEGACCASIPIIRNLEEYYDNDLLESIEGIVNGSTNYILTKTNSDNLTYAEALHQAQTKGYAESDARLDTEGFDAKYKLLILLAHAFGLILKPEEIFNLGINHLGELELSYAREKGLKVKLVAFAERNHDNTIRAYVLPKFIDKEDKLFSVDDVFNGVKTKSVFSDTQFFVGKGAGAYPTASAVLSDISALSYNYRYEYKKLNQSDRPEAPENIYLRVLLRTNEELQLSKPYFNTIEEIYSKKEEAYIIGITTLAGIKQLYKRSTKPVSVVLIDNIEAHKVSSGKQELNVEWA